MSGKNQLKKQVSGVVDTKKKADVKKEEGTAVKAAAVVVVTNKPTPAEEEDEDEDDNDAVLSEDSIDSDEDINTSEDKINVSNGDNLGILLVGLDALKGRLYYIVEGESFSLETKEIPYCNKHGVKGIRNRVVFTIILINPEGERVCCQVWSPTESNEWPKRLFEYFT
jgi:hypothetical protein